MIAPPVIEKIYSETVAQFERARRIAASGVVGCQEARRRMVALRAEILRLEVAGQGRPS